VHNKDKLLIDREPGALVLDLHWVILTKLNAVKRLALEVSSLRLRPGTLQGIMRGQRRIWTEARVFLQLEILHKRHSGFFRRSCYTRLREPVHPEIW